MKTVFLHCCWGMIRDEVLSAIIFFETETVSKHLMFFQLDYPDVLALQMFSALFIYLFFTENSEICLVLDMSCDSLLCLVLSS